MDLAREAGGWGLDRKLMTDTAFAKVAVLRAGRLRWTSTESWLLAVNWAQMLDVVLGVPSS